MSSMDETVGQDAEQDSDITLHDCLAGEDAHYQFAQLPASAGTHDNASLLKQILYLQPDLIACTLSVSVPGVTTG